MVAAAEMTTTTVTTTETETVAGIMMEAGMITGRRDDA